MTVIPVIGYNFYQMFFIFIFWSFIGWMIEIVDMSYETGAFQNRGFLNMPICPIYGVGVLMILIIFRPMKDTYLLLGVVSTVLCTAFEYFMGWLMETLFHTRWWDYSHMKFNIKGYICLRNSLFFGSGCVLMYHFFEPWYEGLVAMIPVKAGWTFIVIMSLLIVIDTIASAMAAARLKKRLKRLDEISAMMLSVSEMTGMKLADGTLAVKSGINKAKDSAGNIYELAKDTAESAYERAKDTAGNAYDTVSEKAMDVKARVAEINAENLEKLRTEYEKLLVGDNFTNRLMRSFPRMISRRYSRALRAIRRRLKIHKFNRKFLDELKIKNRDYVNGHAEEYRFEQDLFEEPSVSVEQGESVPEEVPVGR